MVDFVPVSDLSADRSSYPTVSQHSDPNSILTQFLEIVPAEPYANDPTLRQPWFDPLDPRIDRLMRAIKTHVTVDYRGEPITTLSKNAYGNTSLWWVILLYNGAFHQDELVRNSQINVPSLTTTISKLVTPKINKAGTVVVA